MMLYIMLVLPLLVRSFHNFKQSSSHSFQYVDHKLHSSTIDTIFALSSGSVMKAGVAVIRLSGPQSKYCIERLLQSQPFPKPRMASLRYIQCPQTNEAIDKGLILWFPGPKSFTGEDCAELHVHSGRAVITGVLETLGKLDDIKKNIRVRPAERGEFTQRAFFNGKMDLTEVEGLADLLAADTSEQRKQALKQMDGNLKRLYENWRTELIQCLAHTEAVIDFGDDDREDDVNESVMWSITPKVQNLRDQLMIHLKDGRKGEILREGIQIALVGPPNAGKSSLLNYLAKRPASIVSPIAGTTRDIVEVRMDLQGTPCIIRDTAGLRLEEGTTDEIEKEGMRRAREALKNAQIKIIVSDASDPTSTQMAETMYNELLSINNSPSTQINPNIDNIDTDLNDSDNVSSNYRVFFVSNKIDNIPLSTSQLPLTKPTLITDGIQMYEEKSDNTYSNNRNQYSISCLTGEGVNEFERALGSTALSLLRNDSDEKNNSNSGDVQSAVITRERHRSHVKRCISHLDQFLSCELSLDVAAEELRLAMLELGRVTGRVDVEELLDVIFRDFCIGK